MQIVKKIFLGLVFIAFLAMVFIAMLVNEFIAVDSVRVEDLDVYEDTVHLPIIMYHSIDSNESRQGKFVITPSQLKDDIEYILKKGYEPIFMQDAIDFVDGKRALPKKPIILTFDDGYYNNLLNAMPLFKKYNVKAVISIIASEADKYSRVDDTHERYASLSWEHIASMQSTGLVEFQNHSYDLHRFTEQRKGAEKSRGESVAQYRERFKKDTATAQESFMKNLGRAPNTYTYPFGRISRESYLPIIELGFRASLDVSAGVVTLKQGKDSCLYRMNRYTRTNTYTASDIIAQYEKSLSKMLLEQ